MLDLTDTDFKSAIINKLGFSDNSVGKESAFNAWHPIWFLGWEDVLENG